MRKKSSAVPAVVIPVSESDQPAAITAAIAKGDWETVLSLDATNSDGLQLKAAADKAAAITVGADSEPVTQKISASIVPAAKERQIKAQKEVWKHPAVIGSSLVAVICVLVFLISLMFSGDAGPGGGGGQNSAEIAAAITAALAKGDWETVLSLDPDNSEGKQMQAAAEKKTAITAALAKGDWKAVLFLDPTNSEGLQLKADADKAASNTAFNVVKADAVTAALAKGDWKAVLSLDPDNSEGKQMQAAAEKKTAITAALAKGDWETVLSLDPDNSEGLQLKAAAEKTAMAAAKAAMAAAKKAAFLAGDPITNTLDMTLNKIPAGTFMMGSPETEKDREDDEQQHKVTISKPFYMQTTEVTQGQWMAVMGTEPWKGQEGSEYVKEGPDYAASYVKRDDAVAYCKS